MARDRLAEVFRLIDRLNGVLGVAAHGTVELVADDDILVHLEQSRPAGPPSVLSEPLEPQQLLTVLQGLLDAAEAGHGNDLPRSGKPDPGGR